MHVELLFAYVSAIALLIAIILYPSVRSYVKENLCLKGLWPCVARAAPWLMVALVPAVDAMESHVYRSDPLKKVPMLDEHNYQAWKFFILLAFKSVGVGLYGLYHLYSLPKDTTASSSGSSSSSGSGSGNGTGLSSGSSNAAGDDSKTSTTASLAPLTSRQKDDIFSIIARTVSSSLYSLVITLQPGQAVEAWQRITDHFVQTTRGARNLAMSNFLKMKKADSQTFDEFLASVEFAANHVNSLAEGPLVSTEQKTMVLMDGLRGDPEYKVVLEMLDGAMLVNDSADPEKVWNETCRHLKVVAGRVKLDKQLKDSSASQRADSVFGMSAGSSPSEPCRNYARGHCRFGSRCKYSHGGSHNNNVDAQHELAGTRGRRRDTNRVKCTYCHKHGHEYKKCRKKARDDKGMASQVANLAKDIKALMEKQNQFAFRLSEERPAWWESSRSFQVICLLTMLLGVASGLQLGWSTLVATFTAMVSVEFLHVILLVVLPRCRRRRSGSRSAVRVDDSIPVDTSRLSLTKRELLKFRSLRRVTEVAGKATWKSKSGPKTPKARKHLSFASRNQVEGQPGFRLRRARNNPYEYAFPATENGQLFATCLAFYAGGMLKLDGKDTTIFDTGATSSMFNNKKWFNPHTLVPCSVEIVIADGKKIKATHRGTAVIRSVNSNGEQTTVRLKECLLVPSLQHNLISTQRLDAAGCQVSIANGELKVRSPGGAQCLLGISCGGLYHLVVRGAVSGQSISLAATYTGGLSQLDLWHRRLGHASLKYLKYIVPSEVAKKTLSYCDACVRAKATRRPYKHNKVPPRKVEEPLDVFAADMCGPFPTTFVGGYKYFVVVVDVATRFVFVFLVRAKSEVAGRLFALFALIKNQVGRLPKRFHYDGGTEVNTNAVKEYMEQHGIQFTTTTAGSSNQNAVAERMHRTLAESARAMLAQAGASSKYFLLAICYAAYVHNRLPREHNNGRSPQEVFPLPGRPDGTTYAKLWGCSVDAFNPESAKSEPSQVIKCVFLGVDAVKQGFLLLDLAADRIFVSRDVTFNETVFPFLDCANQREEKAEETDVWLWLPGVSESVGTPPAPPSAPPSAPSSVPLDQVDEEAPDIDPGMYVSPEETEDGGDVSEQRPPSRLLPSPPSGPPPLSPAPRRSARGWVPSGQALRNLVPDAANVAKRSFPRRAKVSSDPEVPATFKKAITGPRGPQWFEGCREEYQGHLDRRTFVEVPRSSVPPDRRILTSRWVFRLKRNVDHSIARFKARLTVRGCQQVAGVDYDETFAAVAQMKSFRLLCAIAASLRLLIHQFDFTQAFVSADIDRDVFMEHPEGFPGTPGTVLKLLKSLYGLAQSPRNFQLLLVDSLLSFGLLQMQSDVCFFRHPKFDLFVVCVVDDLAVAFKDQLLVDQLVAHLSPKFDVNNLGCVSRFNGLQV